VLFDINTPPVVIGAAFDHSLPSLIGKSRNCCGDFGDAAQVVDSVTPMGFLLQCFLFALPLCAEPDPEFWKRQ
jgi:hypothetical protein